MELTRKQVIEELQRMLDYYIIRQDSTPERQQALTYAIASLKTDEAYKIMYEGGEVFTKTDMIVMLENVRLDIIAHLVRPCHECVDYGCVRWSSVDNAIKKRIDALRGEENEG